MNISLEKHKIVPVIDTVYSFNNAPGAFQQLQEGSFGKTVISMNR